MRVASASNAAQGILIDNGDVSRGSVTENLKFGIPHLKCLVFAGNSLSLSLSCHVPLSLGPISNHIDRPLGDELKFLHKLNA